MKVNVIIIVCFFLFFLSTPSISFAFEVTPIDLEQAIVKERIIQYFNPLALIDNQVNKLSLTSLRNTYTVQAGDQLIEIASRFGIPINQLIMVNNLYNPDNINEGQTLVIPVDYLWKIYNQQDRLTEIAKVNNINVKEIIRANPELHQQEAYIGQLVAIPQSLVYRSMVDRNNKNKVVSASRSAAAIPMMIWPVTGKITSKFGYRWGQLHSGIDIWNEAGKQANIYAAYDGVVTTAENSNNGYGKLVVIQHSNQLETYYAHLSQIFVEDGQKVQQGELLGKMGNTGNTVGTTGIHLHFEIRYQAKPYNPLIYLK